MLYSRFGFTSSETAPMKKPPMLKGRSDPVFDLLTKSPHKERRKPEQRSTLACCSPGVLRVNDDVVVQDGQGNTVHVPPPAAGLAVRLRVLSRWINQSHNDPHRADYLHPLIKGIALHFALGYEHPFRDGNGRVARALFYWFMFKNDFSAFRYIAISVLLRNAPVKYGRSYLNSEADDLDLTYFIDFQCWVVLRAVSSFTEAYRKSLVNAESFDRWLSEFGFFERVGAAEGCDL